MPPEVLEGSGYTGYNHDLFALGIILFILATGRPPFGKADQHNDPFYNLIAKNKASIFWQYHEQQGLPYPLSHQFKDLIISMFQPNPANRLGVADIFAS